MSSPRTTEAGVPDTRVVHVGDTIDVSADAAAAGESVTFTLGSASEVEGVFVHSQTGTLKCAADDEAADPAVDTACDTGGTGNTVTVKFMVTEVNGATATTDPVITAVDAAGTDTAVTFAPASASYYNHSHNVDGNAGETVTVTFDLSERGGHNTGGAGTGDFYRISASSVGSGTFASNGQNAIDCADSDKGTGCDTDKADERVGLRIAIAGDSAKGKIIVERYERQRGEDPDFRDSIEVNVVSVAAPVASLTLEAEDESIAAAGGTTTLSVTMLEGDNDLAPGRWSAILSGPNWSANLSFHEGSDICTSRNRPGSMCSTASSPRRSRSGRPPP